MRVQRAQSLDKALPCVAGFIAERTGIPVIRDGEARCDGQTIFLPARRSELELSERDRVESVAYLYHEAGHILYTDFGPKAETPLKWAFVQILEDIRIERRVMQKFPVARRYLETLTGYMADPSEGERGFKTLDGSESEAVIVQAVMLYRLRYEALGQKPVAELSRRAHEVASARLPTGMLTRLEALMFEVERCENTQDVFELADAIIQMIAEEAEKERERENGQGQQQSSPESGQQDGTNGASQQGASTEGRQSCSGSDQSGGSPDALQQKGDGTSSQEAGGQANAQEASGQDAAQALERILNMSEQDVQQGLGEMLKDAINDSAQDADRDGICVSMPNVQKAVLPASDVDLAAIRASINATRTRTLQWMNAVTEGDISYSRSGMQIASSRIWQGRLGGSIFVREDEGIDLNAAVSIMIDRSGSMHSMIGSAAQAAVAMMFAFDTPGLKTQVSVFPWSARHGTGVGVVKGWEENSRQLASRVTSLTASGGTPMAEAVLFAATDIARREEALKIVMVITDGEPDNLAAARYIVRRVRNDGITVVGLGIGTDPSSVFGSRYAASLSNVDELSSSMVKLVRTAFEDHRNQQ